MTDTNDTTPDPTPLRLRGTGGAVFRFSLETLSEVYLQQIRQGRLQPVDAASAKALADAGIRVGV